jgi:hypothetical protein
MKVNYFGSKLLVNAGYFEKNLLAMVDLRGVLSLADPLSAYEYGKIPR